MPKKKRPAFGGDTIAAERAKMVADVLKESTDAYADLEDVRAWAREGRVLLARTLKRFPHETRAIHEHRADPSDEKAMMLSIAGLGALGAIFTRDCKDPIGLIETLIAAEDIVREIGERLPVPAKLDGANAVDVLLCGAGHTVEEVATALNAAPATIEKRRERRKKR
jgi:hypothetical protein